MASSGVSAGIKFSFKSTSDRGAFLVLPPLAISKLLLCKARIINYMRANFAHWVEFENTTVGNGLREEEILFVSGTTKTNQWAVVAFCNESQKVEGSCSVNLGSLGEASVSMSVSREKPRMEDYRIGPSRRTAASGRPAADSDTGSPSPSPSPEPRDQCIFIHYYKMKRRFKWMPMRIEAAGAADRGPGCNDGSDPESDFMVVDDFGFSAEEECRNDQRVRVLCIGR